MRKKVRSISVLLIFAIFIVSTITGFYNRYLPDSYYVSKNNSLKLSCFFDVTAEQKDKFMPSNTGNTPVMGEDVTLKLFGVVPIKDVKVVHVNRPVVVPGGNPFGIKILTEGVMVIGLSEVDGCDGKVSPASQSGIKTGDIIIAINGNKIMSKESIADAIIKSQGESVIVDVKRGSKLMRFEFKPEFSLSESTFKAGMWVRDSSAGIGTITFYDPQTQMFGGLGHPVCDSDTGEIIPLHSGEVVPVTINGVTKGIAGTPGELIGSFVSSFSMGSLLLNNQCGLFGKLDSAPNQSSAIPIAYKQEVQKGHATILTTINGNSPQEYDIEIENIDLSGNDSCKNLTIRITDAELLDKCGGIIQGMSGSPILQDGKIVGAVTHVFVNEPTRGYGIFIESMYNYSRKLAENAA